MPPILLLSENFPPVIGGSARWLWELYRRMPRPDVVIAAGACPGDSAFDLTHDLRVERLPLSFADRGVLSIGSWRTQRRAAAAIRALIRRTGVHQVHCGRVLPEGWLALRCGTSYCCFVHGEELNTAQTSRQLYWMARCTLARARVLFANSRNTARLLREQWTVPDDKIRIVHPGVDTRRFIPAAWDEAARTQLGWSGRMVVLTVGRLQKRKGHDRMIEAVAMLAPRFPDLLYAIIGAGEEAAALKEQVRRTGLDAHVRFHGAVDDDLLVRAYQQADVFILPNRTVAGDFEGFGIVLLEAQACGCAVIAGSSGGTREAIRPDETGLIIDCTQPAEIAAAVSALLSDAERRRQMGAQGRRWVEHAFDFDARAAGAVQLLASV
jgi:phosphatidyl-myo-inositol dimannoside synthase